MTTSIIGQVHSETSSAASKKDHWDALFRVAKFAASFSKSSGVSKDTVDFLENVSKHLGAIVNTPRLLTVGANVYDTLGKFPMIKSLRDIIARDFTEATESEIYKLWEKSEDVVGKNSFSAFKTVIEGIKGVDKEMSGSLTELSKDLAPLMMNGHIDKIVKGVDTVFVHPKEHAGEMEEGVVSMASGILGVASVVLPLIMKVPSNVVSGISALSTFMGLVEYGNKSMLTELEKNKRAAKESIGLDFAKLQTEERLQRNEPQFRKGNPNHEYNKQFMAFEKGGTAKDIHEKTMTFQGKQAFYDKIDRAESSQDVGGILNEYLGERNQLEILGGTKPEKATEQSIIKLSQKLNPA